MAQKIKKLDTESYPETKEIATEEEKAQYPSGWNHPIVKSALLLIGINNTDKTARDKQNLVVNDIMKEASIVNEPTKPRYVGAKKAKQAVTKTAERLQMPQFSLKSNDADEDTEILMTNCFRYILNQGNYDWSYSGPNGIIDGILRYGDKYRLIYQGDKSKTSFPAQFKTIDGNNLWFSISATSFRNGNKNVTRLVAMFRGTVREFCEEFPEHEDLVEKGIIKPGFIPRNFSYKDLDQTSTQKFQNAYAAIGMGDDEGDDEKQMEWMYIFDSSKRCFGFVVGAELTVLEEKEDKDYPFIFENIEGKKEAYIPVSNFMCLPAEEGIYHVSIVAYLFDMCIVFRRTINQIIGHVEENTYPHTLVNIPQGQEGSFMNLVEMANQMRAHGQNAYIPITYNPNNPAGNISSANPILNGGDIDGAQKLMNILDDEFKKCGIYLDDPLNSDPTELQIQQNAANASILPKAITKYNTPTMEFELMVALDMCKKYIKTGDKTPLVLDTTIDLPDGKYSIRGIPFTLGWFKEELLKRTWKPKIDSKTGAVTDDMAALTIYKSILPSMTPGSPQYDAINEKIMLLSGVTLKAPNPVSANQALSAQQGAPGGGGQPPASPPDQSPPLIPGGLPNAPGITGVVPSNPALQAIPGMPS